MGNQQGQLSRVDDHDPPSANKPTTKETFPHNYDAIRKDFDSDPPIDTFTPEKRRQQLQAGMFLNGKKMKFWVDHNGNNCFMVFANGLSIIWGDTPSYWYLHNEQTSENELITVAQLRNVCWLQVDGSLDISNLSPGVTYQVTFIIKLENSGYGWDPPVNFKLTLPDKNIQESKEILKYKPKNEWLHIPVGEVMASPKITGKFEFSLYEHGGHWKKGLVVKGVSIKPKH